VCAIVAPLFPDVQPKAYRVENEQARAQLRPFRGAVRNPVQRRIAATGLGRNGLVREPRPACPALRTQRQLALQDNAGIAHVSNFN